MQAHTPARRLSNRDGYNVTGNAVDDNANVRRACRETWRNDHIDLPQSHEARGEPRIRDRAESGSDSNAHRRLRREAGPAIGSRDGYRVGQGRPRRGDAVRRRWRDGSLTSSIED